MLEEDGCKFLEALMGIAADGDEETQPRFALGMPDAAGRLAVAAQL